MAMKNMRRRSRGVLKRQEGFTLIESVVALGLFAGAVFLLISVFNGFMLDDFPSRSYEALSLAQGEIAMTERDRNFSSSTRDTLGFCLTRDVQLQNGFFGIEVSVSSAARPFIVYTRLSDLCPLQ